MEFLWRLFGDCERIATAFKTTSKARFRKTRATSFARLKTVQAKDVIGKKHPQMRSPTPPSNSIQEIKL